MIEFEGQNTHLSDTSTSFHQLSAQLSMQQTKKNFPIGAKHEFIPKDLKINKKA